MGITPLGLLGLGHHATKYYATQIEKYYLIHHEPTSEIFKCFQTDFATMNALLPNPSNALQNLLEKALDGLMSMEPQGIIIPNITLHETLDNLLNSRSYSARIFHAAHMGAKVMQRQGLSRAVVFGSDYTMNSIYLPRIFEEYGISLSAPKPQHQHVIDQVRRAVYEGRVNHSVMREYLALLGRYRQASTVLIACTEHAAITHFDEGVLNLAQVQVQQAVRSLYGVNKS